mmetsp:Transcript_1956/g.2796  ORF Transcript_1956/g.2796 Transcript_1956/m.2796 type:complete len:135 (-) Transcript_1956:1190-1594(-)
MSHVAAEQELKYVNSRVMLYHIPISPLKGKKKKEKKKKKHILQFHGRLLGEEIPQQTGAWAIVCVVFDGIVSTTASAFVLQAGGQQPRPRQNRIRIPREHLKIQPGDLASGGDWGPSLGEPYFHRITTRTASRI